MKKYTFLIFLLIGSFIFGKTSFGVDNSVENILQAHYEFDSSQNPKAKSIILTSPNGGEVWQAGTEQIIKWNSSEINYVTLQYSTNNGINWTNIDTDIEASLWQYAWSIPGNITPSQEFRIRIFDKEQPAITDDSDNKFIVTKLLINAPALNTTFQTGQNATIEWFASADILNVDIDISYNNGAWESLVANYDASLGQYTYNVVDNPNGFNKIRISNSANTNINYISDYFRIAKLQLLTPNTAVSWFNNSSHAITWNSSGITDVGLDYSTDNGLTWNVIVNSVSASPNSYSWTVPSVASNQALVKVYDKTDATVFDVSDVVFTINKLSINSPIDITGWLIGEDKTINWETNLAGNVKIEISFNNGTNWTQIANNISAVQGSYLYTVPNNPTNRGKIRITSLADASNYAVSTGNFTIGSIAVVYPAGGEVFRAGGLETIQWTSTSGINLIKIEYSIDGGLNWNLITANAPAGAGQYDWAIPSNLSSSNALIRLGDSESDNGLNIVSSSFTISGIIITSPIGNEIRKGGTAFNITWSASPNIANVKIEYDENSSGNWQIVVNSTPANTGLYTWNIPENVSIASGRIRISSTNNALVNTISDGFFKIGNVWLTLPNGGEKLVGNGNYTIQWTNTASINLINLQYSLDGGITYINIPGGSNYPAGAGSFNWTVPNILTNTAKIKISDAEGPIILDASDNNFSIAQLTLTYPNGGEGFAPGMGINITWTSTNINTVNLQYQTDNGQWINIATDINSALGTYPWIIPNAFSANALVRIVAAENTDLFDISDNFFKIGSIQVLSPNNGNEVYQVGTNQVIQWNSSPGVSNVDIDLTTNNGTDWISLASDQPSTGSYNWVVTNAPSATSKIRISDNDHPAISDISDNNFNIKNVILNYPNGHNFFLVDSTINITWNAYNVANVKLEYSPDGGGVIWKTIKESVASAPAVYSWKIPNEASERVLVRISDVTSSAINDISDDVFSINKLYVLFPDGGQNFVVNSIQNVKWIAHSSVNNIRLEYTTNNGNSWIIVENSIPSNPSSYNWSIPNTPTNQARIRVIDIGNPEILDVSNALFGIGSILLTSPNGGQRYQVGSTHAITWSNISTVSLVDLEYTTNNGTDWTNIATNYNASLETYNWTIPNSVSTTVKVRIKNSLVPSLFDMSNNDFSIVALSVSGPNGGEVYQVGKNLPITWVASGISFVNIDYSNDNGNTWANIAGNLDASIGNFDYSLPDLPTLTGLVRLTDTQDGSIVDISNATFKVLRLNLGSPNGGESYKIGINKNITWNSSGINNLNIKYSIDNGTNWLSIVDNFPAAAGSYNWMIPNSPGNSLKVKIQDANNIAISDSSEGTFTVGSISVVEPVVGEILQANTVKQIKWTSTQGVQSVKIEYRKNNSSAWQELAIVPSNLNGTYNWAIPNDATSQAKIRISHDASVTSIVDSSGQFIINTLNLLSPNGVEYYKAGSTKNITWTSSISGNLKLEYSSNNGSTWNTIIASTPAINNLFSWVIPSNLSSKQMLVKLTDLTTPTITDSSQNVFKVGNISIDNIFGGELWQTNTSKVINFTASSSVEEVNIEYSTDGINYIALVNNYPASSGTYTWNIGNVTPTSNGRIRISDSESALGIATISNAFNIIKLDLESPIGGELWQAGSINSIKWLSSNHIATVNLYYSTNSGTDWNIITGGYASVSNDTNRYNWSIPANLSSTNMLVKVENVVNNIIVDQSTNKFTIGNLGITSPVLTDKLQSGRNKTIAWSSSNIGNIKIDYSLDNGTTWQSIINSISSDLQSYVWQIPANIAASQARIRLTSLVNSGVISISNPFVIKLLEITSPNGGETWQAGSTRSITWNSTEVNSLSLYYSNDNGATWSSIATNIPAATHQYSWNIPINSASNATKILLVDESLVSIRDSSSTSFTINSLVLSSPIGNEVWQAGTTKQITWGGLNLGLIQLDYSLDNGTSWTKIIDNVNGQAGSYNWTIPYDTASNSAKIRIVDISDPTNFNASGIFTINRLQVYSPNGGENWQAGSTKSIKWHSRFINDISIDYSIDNGATWINITNNIAANTFTYNWSIPSNLSTSNARIKIYDSANPNIKDSSDVKFSISNIGITAPIAGAQLMVGTQTTVTWSATNLGNVDLLYSIDNGTTWNAIVNNIASSINSYNWNIPANVATNQALVRLQSVSDPTINVTSGVFTISNLLITSPAGGEIWQAGSIKAITWQHNFVNNINLSYSLNSGTTWTQIDSNIPAISGSYNWSIPSNITGATCLIKIEDAGNPIIKSVSTNIFTIGILSLTSPVINEHIQTGSTKNITWNSSNLGLINLEYSIDNGVSWNTIVNNIQSAVLSYNWVIPVNASSANAKVRALLVSDNTISSVTPAFIISILSVTSPNGLEIWQSGSNKSITWISQNINNVSIDYTINNGANWVNIVGSVAGNLGTYTWNIPAVLSSSLIKIRVSDADYSNVMDISDNAFAIKSISVQSPNGGEFIQAGLPYTIKWNNSANVIDVKIELSKDNGTSWESIINSTTADGEYIWNVPTSATTATGLIRITDVNSGNAINDVSDLSFIVNSLILTSPNGFENLKVGSTQNITWTASNNITNVTLEYFTESKGWKSIVSDINAALGTYSWTVPNDPSDSVRVRVKSSTNNSIYDVSDNAFRIANIAVTSPNTSVRWQIGTIQSITWTNSGNVKFVNLDYSIDGGINWKAITTLYSAQSGSYKWVIPNDTSLTAKVRVTDASSSGIISDVNDVNFIINKLQIIEPDGTLPWLAGSTQQIKWLSTQDIDSIYIKLSIDGGTSFSNISKVKANLGTYNWTIPQGVNSNNCFILVSDTKFETIKDTSNQFTILPASLTLTSPIGGEFWQINNSYNITWTKSSVIQNIKIEITTDNGTSWNTISNSYPADSLKYNYLVPANMFTNVAKIRITDVQNSFVSSISSATFNIAGLQLTSFNNGGNYSIGKTQNITWVASNISNIDIDYSTTEGVWKSIAVNVAANLGTYSWIIPNDPSNTVKIRVKNSVSNQVFDLSDNEFRIASLTVTSPNVFQKWQVGTIKQIKWSNTSNVQNINLFYSTNNGTNWTAIETNLLAATGTYNWSVPDFPNTKTLIRVNDVIASDFINDISDTVITISKLELTVPTGGEVWASGSQQNINWSASSDIDSVGIYLSLDNGNIWSLLTLQKATNNQFSWTIPQLLSSNSALIKIIDTKYISVNDVSNSFTIYPLSLNLTSPIGGEYWQEGKSYNITWTKSPAVQNIKIEITTDNGTTWNAISNSYPADSLKFAYLVPSGMVTNVAKIRITDIQNTFISGISGSTFVISGLQLTSLNNSGNYTIGTTQNITWTAGNNIANIDIDYSTAEGIWKSIAVNVAANLGTYSWIIPNDPSNTVKIRIRNSVSNQIFDISENEFRIARVLITSPNIFQKWQVGSINQIKWSNSANVLNVNLYFSTNNGVDWSPIETNVLASSGVYNWSVPDYPNTTTLIRVNDVIASDFINDISDAVIAISKLELTAPTGGEVWASGSQQDINWTSSADIDSVDIYLSLDNGNIWSLLSKQKGNVNTYKWTIPQAINSSDVLVLVRDNDYNNVKDTSNKITIYPPQLKVISPNGGEYIAAGENYDIKWQSSADVKNIRIEYRLKSDTLWSVIQESFPADSFHFGWVVPAGISSNTAKIRLTDVLQPFIQDSSDNNFKIGWVLVETPNGGEHIQVGRRTDIKWSTSSNVSNVKLEYSTNGIDYTTVVASIAANIGTYNWLIPNTSSTTVKIRVSDAVSNNNIKDLSDNNFIISLLQLTTPSSSIQLQAGTVYNIKWNSSSDIDYVNLEYTLDGTIWNAVNQDSINAHSGTFAWTIPSNLCSGTGKIRIWDNSAITINDTSKYPITFKELNIIAPSGGENWQVGTTKVIRWSACQVDTLTIEYSYNNGQNWLVVADNIDATQGIYNWVIPNTISNSVYVRLIDKTNPLLYSQSNQFSIFNPNIKLLIPNGGEVWQAGSTKDLHWEGEYVDFVKIEFSSDFGTTWNVLASSWAVDSVYSWSIPSTVETKGAIIKVSDVLNSHIKDSSLVFTVTQLTLTGPLGGEYWQSGTEQTIKWHAGAGLNFVRLQYSSDNGSSWANIADAQNIVASADSFKWAIPATIGTNLAKIRVLDILDQTINSSSTDSFTIGWVKVISPNGGQVLQAGYSVNVRWDNSDNIRTVNVEVFNPITNQIIRSTAANASLKQINLLIPSNYYSDSLKIRLSEANSNYLIVDLSDSYISVKGIDLITPIVGSNWKSGSTEVIRWEASPNNDKLNIEYSSNGGLTWNSVVNNLAANLEEYSWDIPLSLASDQCIVKLYNSVYTDIKDSSGIFNVYVPGINLVSPNGNNFYQAGKTYKVRWSSSFVTSVRIEYSSNNGATWDTLKAPLAASLQEWDWNIPNRTNTDQGLIRISDYSNSAIKDVSDDVFVIGWIDVTSPDGGENWLAGTSKDIRWENSNSVSTLNIYYNSGLDTTWQLLATNYPASNMPYVWAQVPSTETNRGKIKITDAKSNSEIANSSSDFFSITKLYVLTPNGGEVLYSNNTYKIKWTPSININSVKIELSTNGGRTWGETITSSTSATVGYFDWLIKGTIFSDSSLIRLTDVENNDIIDISDGLFTIGAINLSTFDNVEKVLEKSVKKIQWINSANIQYVDLLYRTKDKVWKPIVNGTRVSATDEQFNWVIPEEPSDSCYILIRNSDNYTFSDTSKSAFTISRLKLASPNGSEVWQTGTVKEFTWQSSYVGQVYIKYTTDTSAVPVNFEMLPGLTQPILAELGKYTWTIPDDINLAGKTYRFRIYDITEAKVADTTNSYSTLSYMRVVSPNNGEQIGTSHLLKWSNSINTISKVNIYIQREISDFNWTLIKSNVDSDPSSYLWNINIDPSQTCRIKIEDANNRNIFDVSDGPFTVSSVKLTYPNGGKYQKLQVGKTYDITWESSFINLVRLEFSTNNGTSWNVVPNANSLPASEKRFTWYIDDLPSRDTRIRISDAGKESIFDLSDTTFNVCKLELTSQNTLSAYQVGETYDITWESVNIDSLRIQLSLDDGRTWSRLEGISDADSGRFRWKVPNILSALARIRITDFYEATVNDTSNSNFVIGKFPTVVAYKPFQSNVVKFLYEFLTPQETINIDRVELQIGEGGVRYIESALVNPPALIQGPTSGVLDLNSKSVSELNDFEGKVKIWITFRSPQYNVTYRVFIDSVGIDNKPPVFDKSKVDFYQMPEKFGWGKVIAKWEPGTDLNSKINYHLTFNDINNEFINFDKTTQEDSVVISNVWSSVNYLIKIEVSDDYQNNVSYVLEPFKSLAISDFSGDNELNSLDLAQFVKLWSSKDSTIGVDLAPYDGNFPYLKVRGDSKLNIEDLLVFVNMWNYGQEFTLPKQNHVIENATGVIREQITFKDGENKFNFPISINEKDNLLALTAKVYYQPGVFKFDSLKVNGISENSGITFVKNDTINGFLKIDFAELNGKLKNNISISSLIECSFDRLAKQDSLYIQYTGYNDKLQKVIDKTVVYTLHEIPANYKLYQNYPNPFNPLTTIEYDLPEKAKVNLAIYDILGREVAVLVNGEQNIGSYRIAFDANVLRKGLASGVYFYRLSTNNFNVTKKMLLLK